MDRRDSLTACAYGDAEARGRVVRMVDRDEGDRFGVLRVEPEWGSWTRVVGIVAPSLSAELGSRIRAWNDIWQHYLNPQERIHWEDPEVGRRWIAEGKSLVMAIQEELGSSIRVVEGFSMYSPDE